MLKSVDHHGRERCRVAGLLAAAGLAATLTIGSVADGQVLWKSGSDGAAPEVMSANELTTSLRKLASRDEAKRVVVHTSWPLTNAVREEIESRGLKLLDFLGNGAYFASIERGAFDAPALTATLSIVSVEAINPMWKLHPDLAQGIVRPWTVVEQRLVEADVDHERVKAGLAPALGVESIVAVYVVMHRDADLEVEGSRLVRRHGGSVRSVVKSGRMLVVHLPASSIAALADEDAVQYIEPALPKFSELNAENRVITGVNIVNAPPYGLDGSGVTVQVFDGGRVRTTHIDFQGRAINGDTANQSDHATHVTGTVGGGGVANANNRGMAPGVELRCYGFEAPLQQGFLYTDPGDIEQDYLHAITTWGATVVNNSIGTNTAPNGFPCSWEGDYSVTDTVIDAIVRGSLGAPYRVVWANGNERQGQARCGSTYHTTAPPACAKNHITVGALNANDDSVTSFTSWGPADDGRMKPDISGPGCQSGGDNGVTSTSSSTDSSYNVKCGTSMAAPTVTGICALLIQDFRANYSGEPDPRNSTLKAILAHTAQDIQNPGPDYQTGYGSVRAPAAVDFLRTGNFFEDTLNNGDSAVVIAVVAPGDPELKITLAWDDVPGTPNVDPALVNDLDLVVYSPSGVRHYPWTLGGLANPAAPAVRTQENHTDNIEQVFVENPEPGGWIVEIRATDVPDGPQPFSVCVSPFLVNCSDAGIVRLDANVHNCSSVTTVKVVDCGLNTSDMVVDTVMVNVKSDTDPVGQTIVLTETAPESATFLGSVMLSSSMTPGTVRVSHGDTLTATYEDADDGTGSMATVTSTSTIDCVGPVVSNVATIDVLPRSATVTFDTDEPAMVTVHYGASCGSYSGSVQVAGFASSHAVMLTGLADDQQYFYEIEAVDEAGNFGYADNGGACFSFTTPEVPDFFTQLFAAGEFDLVGKSLLLIPDAGVDQYVPCLTDIADLPTDPSGGTALVLGDATNQQVFLSGGAQIKLYGVSYGNFFIGSNGYVTFVSGDTDSTESYADHFNRARISGLFDDLDPTEGGLVSWKQESDRAVVTWDDVPTDGTSAVSRNTFQIEMFYDGCIRMSWVRVDSTTVLVGLSKGTGIDPDFYPSVLSSYTACGPRAPTSSSQIVETPRDIALPITLFASDDGLPDPPGALSYVILSLPAQPLRDANNNQPILFTPYVLSGGNQVIYEPSGGFQGFDGFEWLANDGGSGPDGGDSATASVTIFVEPVLSLPFEDTFPDSTFDPLKWSSVETAVIDALGLNEPSPLLSARFNGHPNGGDSITTHFIDLAPYGAVKLEYHWQRTGGGERPDANEDLIIEYLNDALNWQIIHQHPGSGPNMTEYQYEEVTLAADALHSRFKLRIRNTGTASSTSFFDDWFVDDVRIVAPEAPVAFGQAIAIQVNETVDVTLDAVDPQMDPMDFTIVSLPTSGTLTDLGSGVINAVPHTLAGGGNVVRYKPVNGFQGNVSFQFVADDGQFVSNTATVNIQVGGPQVVHEWLVDDTNPGWSTMGDWAFGQPTGGGTGSGDPVSGYTGLNVYGYNLNGNYPNNLNPTQYLTTSAFDCTDVTGTTLEFRRWLGIESSTWDQANIQVSNDGVSWITVWQHSGPTFSESSWSLQSYDISAVADNQPTVYLRWGMGTTDSSVTYPGWNIDDIQILGLVPVPTGCEGDADGSGSVDIDDLTYVVLRLGAVAPNDDGADVDESGMVDTADITYVVLRLGQCP